MAGDVVAMVVLAPAAGGTVTGGPPITGERLREVAPDPGAAATVAAELRAAGFQVGPLVGVAMSMSGPRERFEDYFGVPVTDAEDGGWVAGEPGRRELPVPPGLAGRVEAVTFEPPAEAVITP